MAGLSWFAYFMPGNSRTSPPETIATPQSDGFCYHCWLGELKPHRKRVHLNYRNLPTPDMTKEAVLAT